MYEQEFIAIDKANLLALSQDMKNEGFRLAQICATKLEEFSLLYSFEKDGRLVSLCFDLPAGEPVPSVGWLYSYAYLYENEMKDLFGVNVTGMTVDFEGHLYTTSVKTPFNPDGGGSK